MRIGPLARAVGAAGLLAAACVAWSASPLSGTGGLGGLLLAVAAACAALSVTRLALGTTPGEPLVYLNPVLRAGRAAAGHVRGTPWAEGLVIATLVLEALHHSRPWHTGLLGAAMLPATTGSAADLMAILAALAAVAAGGLALRPP